MGLLSPVAHILNLLLVEFPGEIITYFTCRQEAETCVGGWGQIYVFSFGLPLFMIAMIFVLGALGASLFGSISCLFLKISSRPKS